MEIPWREGVTLVITDGAVDAIISGLLVLGIANCFFGRRVFRFTMTVVGTVVAAGASAYGLKQAGLGDRHMAVLAGAVLGAVVAALLLVLFYRLALFVVGAAAGFGLGVLFCWVTATEANLGLFVGFALAGGLLTLAVERLLVALISSLFGAVVTAAGVLHFSRRGPAPQQLYDTGGDAAALRALASTPVYVAMGGAALLFLLSLLAQWKLVGKKRAAASKEAEGEKEE